MGGERERAGIGEFRCTDLHEQCGEVWSVVQCGEVWRIFICSVVVPPLHHFRGFCLFPTVSGLAPQALREDAEDPAAYQKIGTWGVGDMRLTFETFPL